VFVNLFFWGGRNGGWQKKPEKTKKKLDCILCQRFVAIGCCGHKLATGKTSVRPEVCDPRKRKNKINTSVDAKETTILPKF
jgi:hypothetical protein